MCRLFGLIANKPVDIRYSFYEAPIESFEAQSWGNPDGWGVAWLEEGGWGIFKEPIPLYESRKARPLIERIVRGRIVVSHVRLASMGELKLENTHPWIYKGWVFAHNGSIDRGKLLALLEEEYRADLVGDTDSEVFFHLIIQEYSYTRDPVKAIINAVNMIVDNRIGFSSLNFIASDGLRLYALRYASRNLDYYTLYYIVRPRGEIELNKLSKETRQLIQTKLSRREKAVVVASEKMSDEPYWALIPNKHLLVVDEKLGIRLNEI